MKYPTRRHGFPAPLAALLLLGASSPAFGAPCDRALQKAVQEGAIDPEEIRIRHRCEEVLFDQKGKAKQTRYVCVLFSLSASPKSFSDPLHSRQAPNPGAKHRPQEARFLAQTTHYLPQEAQGGPLFSLSA
jgi:hypothetical protein